MGGIFIGKVIFRGEVTQNQVCKSIGVWINSLILIISIFFIIIEIDFILASVFISGYAYSTS